MPTPLLFTSGPLAGRKQYAVLFNGQVTKKGVPYPRAVDDEPIVGDDGTTVYLAMEEDEVPDYDPALFTVDALPDEVDAVSKKLRIRRDLVDTSKDEKKMHAAAKRTEKFSEVMGDQSLVLETLVQAVGVLIKKAKLNTLTADQQAVFDSVDAKSAAIQKNAKVLAQKVADIDAGNPVDLDAGWETKAQ